MSPFKEYLDDLLMKQESAVLEFKHAHGGFPGSFWETYSAFANTNGGLILFGVKERNDVFWVDPIDDDLADKLVKTFWKQVRSKDCINICLMGNDDVKVEKYEGNNIIIFRVPRAHLTDRPVYVGHDPLSGTFRRGHEGDYRCNSAEVRQMYADANIYQPADSRLLEFFGMDDIDTDTLNQYRQRMAVANPDHVWLGLDNRQLLEKLGGYRADRRTGKEGLTVAGLLMFGKWSSIRDVEAIPNYGVDYREYTETSERWSHRIYSDGSWEANLFQFFYRVLPRLQSVIETPFRLEGNTRIDHKLAHKSIREALVNAIIHATYGSPTRIVINRFPTEIVVSNPGTMLVSQRQFFSGGQSVCRNQALQVMFSLLGAGDQAGSGGDVILHGWQEENLRAPYIVESDHPDKVDLVLPLESVMSDKINAELIERFGAEVNSLDHNAVSVLALALGEDVTNEKLQYVLDLHPSDITRLLRGLCQDGYLVPNGVGRGTHYKLADADDKVEKVKENDQNEHDRPTDTQEFVGNKGAGLPAGVNDKVQGGELPGESTDKKDVIYAENDGVKNRRDKKILIRELQFYCRMWRKSSDMSRHIGETPQYTTMRLIPEMIKQGILMREYPDTPNHPAQRYRVKPKSKKK